MISEQKLEPKIEGLKFTKPPINPIVKWLVLGFLGTTAMILIFFGLIIYKFAPIFHFDELLKDKITFWSKSYTWNEWNRSLSGSIPLSSGQNVSILFSNGKFEISDSEDSELSWNCNINILQSDLNPEITDEGVNFDFNHFPWIKCTFKIPRNSHFFINRTN